MRLSLFIALRYLFSKKKINAINIITAIAMLGFGVGAFAMVVILSTFNGFEQLVGSMINNYDPELKVNATGAKVFEISDSEMVTITSIPAIKSVTKVLEEKVVLKHNNKQEIARIKGVDEQFNEARFDSLVVLGEAKLHDTSANYGVFGIGLATKISLFPNGALPTAVYVPKRDVQFSALDPEASLSTKYISASGIFEVHEEIDGETFITSLRFARELLDYPTQISSLEVELIPGTNPDEAKKLLSDKLGAGFEIKTRREQNELIYKIFKSEKWFTYAILSLVLVISSFNIFGSLIMLVLDKKKDIGVLKSMGATDQLIRKTFVWQGNYIAMLGGGIGTLLGLLLVLGQMQFGWLKIENSIVDSYPVYIVWTDILLTIGTVLLLGYIISLYPASRAAKVEVKHIN